MFVKVIPAGSWDFKIPTTSMVKVSSRGLTGADRSNLLVKRAADHVFADLIDRVELRPGDIPIHTLAIGATEGYGCFAAGTPFSMADGSYLPIEEVQEDDIALSADGRACRVSHLFRRKVSQSLKIDVCGLADLLHCSLDHPFRVARKEQFACEHDKHKRCLPPTQGQQNICNRPIHFVRDCVTDSFPEIAREWATASSLREGDFLVWTAPQLEPLWPMSVQEGYLLGAWLAEGSFSRNSSNRAVASIRLALHKEEKEFQTRLADAAASLALNYHLYHDNRDQNSATVCITGDPNRFRMWLGTFREHSTAKIIPPWVCCLPRPTRLAIIAGYLDGDGSCCVGDKENRTTARSHGMELSLGFQRLCWSVGFPAVRCRAPLGWNVAIANSYLTDLYPFSWKVRGRELKQTSKIHGFYHEGRMYLPVRGIDSAGELDVFNVEIEGDHTYSGPNIDSHNCNRNGDGFNEDTCRKQASTFVGRPLRDWSKSAHNGARLFRHHRNKDPQVSYGYVKLAAYNPRMRRIELLLIANGTKEAAERNGGLVIPDSTREILERGDDLPGSMACSLPHDVCQNCFHKAASRDEYCTSDTCINPHDGFQGLGCRHGMAQLNKNGRQQFVENPGSMFFDWSEVIRPADRTAFGGIASYMLNKAASTASPVGGADLAELYAAELGDAFVFENRSKTASLRRSLAQLAAADRELSDGLTASDVATAHAFCRNMSPEFLASLGQPGTEKLANNLAKLAAHMICLSPVDFLRLAGVAEPAIEKAAADFQASLPGVFDRLLRDGSLAARIENSLFRLGSPSDATVSIKDAGVTDLSVSSLRKCAELAALRQRQPRFVKSAVAVDIDDVYEFFAKEYAAYKAACISIQDADDPGFVLTLKAASLQNYTL